MNPTEIAIAQRHLNLLGKVKAGATLTQKEISELEKYEKMSQQTKQPETQVKPGRKLTPLQGKFVALFDGNIKTTAEKAGLSYRYCRGLVAKKHIVEAIWARQAKELKPEIATRLQRQKFWTDVMNNDSADMNDRLKASELLGKSEADFTETQIHKFPDGIPPLNIVIEK